jgi:hypothetical protein
MLHVVVALPDSLLAVAALVVLLVPEVLRHALVPVHVVAGDRLILTERLPLARELLERWQLLGADPRELGRLLSSVDPDHVAFLRAFVPVALPEGFSPGSGARATSSQPGSTPTLRSSSRSDSISACSPSSRSAYPERKL